MDDLDFFSDEVGSFLNDRFKSLDDLSKVPSLIHAINKNNVDHHARVCDFTKLLCLHDVPRPLQLRHNLLLDVLLENKSSSQCFKLKHQQRSKWLRKPQRHQSSFFVWPLLPSLSLFLTGCSWVDPA
jgi:hypothetical protein